MKCKFWVAAVAAILSAVGTTAAQAAVIYSENFDVDPTVNWTVNNNNLGTNAANFYYDYSAVGIPSASGPGGTTRGLKIGANLNSATQPSTTSQIPAISVSPTGKSFTGDYELKFKWWANYIGPLNVGASGSTMLSTYGIMTSGTAAQYPGSSDAVSFAATGDGQAAADYRVYSKERQTGYGLQNSGNALDLHVTYAAGGQNSSVAYYATPFPAGATAPAVQAAETSQSNSVAAGSAGFRWNDVSINKVGNIVTWTVNGTLLATVDSTAFSATLTGNNIFFGMSDTNNTTNTSATLLEKFQFTLIDNVEVHGVPEPSTFALVGLAGLGMCAMRRRS